MDIAILNWFDQEIQDSFGNDPFLVEPSVVGPMCALSLYPQVEVYCTDSILRVVDSVSIDSKNSNLYFVSFLNIIKQLDSGPIRTAIAKLAVKTYKLFRKPTSLNVVLECKILYGVDHEFVKLLEESVPAEELRIVDASYGQIATFVPEIFSLSDFWRLDNFKPSFIIPFLDEQYLNSAILSEAKLKWENMEVNSTFFIQFSKQPLPETLRLFIFCRFQLQTSVWNEIKSYDNWEQLQQLMKRLSLTYGMTVIMSPFSFQYTL